MRKIFATALALIALCEIVFAADTLTWAQIFELINKNFPDTPEKRAVDLDRLQNSSVSFYLIDVRSKKEFQVSHIKDALNLTSAAAISKTAPQKDTLILVYCSVGYRSAVIVKDLRSKGYRNSFNLKGGIFQWANSGYKVYKDGTKTSQVHPYNRKWGVLLDEKYHYKKSGFWWN